jgi:hypothetical protein
MRNNIINFIIFVNFIIINSNIISYIDISNIIININNKFTVIIYRYILIYIILYLLTNII